MLSHYQLKQQTARQCSSENKSRAKKAISNAERFITGNLKNEVCSSIAQLNLHIQTLVTQFNQKPPNGTSLPRIEIFSNLDKPNLKALPAKRYHYTVVKKAKVHFDYHIEFEKHYYSVPYQLLEQYLEVHACTENIVIYNDNKIAARHKRKRIYGYSTDKSHIPEADDKNAKWTPERFLKWAAISGEHTFKFVQHILESKEHPVQAFRFLMGLMSWHKNYGYNQLNDVCKIAMKTDVGTLKELKYILFKTDG